jgi:hypothetical protein
LARHRLEKYVLVKHDEDADGVWYGIHELHFTSDHKVIGMSHEPVLPYASTKNDLYRLLQKLLHVWRWGTTWNYSSLQAYIEANRGKYGIIQDT